MGELATSRAVYDLLCTISAAHPPRIRAWDGTEWGPRDAPCTLVLNHPGALRSMLLPPTDLNAGEAYLHGDVDIEGPMLPMIEFAAGMEDPGPTLAQRVRLVAALLSLPTDTAAARPPQPTRRGSLHSKLRDRASVSYHYDTGNEFFSTFLDPNMVYSSAHFLAPDEPLEKAQLRKLDLVCRKLELLPSDHLLDIGCGWGGLALHAARSFGCRVTGITLSIEQATYATDRARSEGLAEYCQFHVLDYRDVRGSFDKIASIGMFEHVGRSQLAGYFEHIQRLLRAGGLVLNHGITTRDRSRSRRKPTFVNTHVFPDGELNPVETSLAQAERAGFEVRDVESLRQSYAVTLRHWVANIEARANQAIAAAGLEAYRIWRLYMAGSAIAFDRAAISVYQTLLADPRRPWTFGRRRLLAVDDA